ncbi:MAG: hypothetical protein QGF33_13815, partial [Alphaproteobacteria bacterium]|nr:hypothetical protein [Alphaproteobacteria bacterium]
PAPARARARPRPRTRGPPRAPAQAGERPRTAARRRAVSKVAHALGSSVVARDAWERTVADVARTRCGGARPGVDSRVTRETLRAAFVHSGVEARCARARAGRARG